MPTNVRRAALSAVICAMIYLALIAGADLQATFGAVFRLEPAGWLLVLALSLVNYGLRFGRWHGYLRRLGQRLPVAEDALVYMAGFAFTTTPGKVGEALRSLYLKPLGVPYSHSLAALFAERLLDLLAMILLAALAVPQAGGQGHLLLVPMLLVPAVLLAVRHPALPDSLLARAGKRCGRLAGAAADMADLLASSRQLLHGRILLGGLLLSVISWGAEGVALYWIAQALGIDISLSAAVGIYAISMLAGALSFIPGGLGSAEAAMGLLLVMMGAEASAAVAATLICRIATLWFAVLLGGLALGTLELKGQRLPQGG